MAPTAPSFSRRLDNECPNYCNDRDIRKQTISNACTLAGENFLSIADGYAFQSAREACKEKEEEKCPSWYDCLLKHACENPIDVCKNKNDRVAVAKEFCAAYEQNEYWGTEFMSLETLKDPLASKPEGEACNSESVCVDWSSCTTKYKCDNPTDVCNNANDRKAHIGEICSAYEQNEFYTFESAKETLKRQYSTDQALIPQGKACNDEMTTCHEWHSCLVEWRCENPCGAGAGGVVADDKGDKEDKFCWLPRRKRRCKQMCNKIDGTLSPRKRASCLGICESKKLCGE